MGISRTSAYDVADRLNCLDYGVCKQPIQPPRPEGDPQVSQLSLGDRVWQGAKAGAKVAAWTAVPAAFGALVAAEGHWSGVDAASANTRAMLAIPLATGIVAGAISHFAGGDDKVNQAFLTATNGGWTPVNTGLRIGAVANGILTPQIAGEAFRYSRSSVRPVAGVVALAAATMAGTTLSAVVGAKAARNAASVGGAAASGLVAGATTAAGVGLGIEAVRATLTQGIKHGNFKSAMITGAVVGAIAGIGGAISEYHSRH